MRYSSFVDRIGGEGSNAWDVHVAAVAAKRAGEDVVVMSVGDPDFDTPDSVRAAAIQALNGGDTHYKDIEGIPALRSEIAAHFERHGGPSTTAENVCVVAGTQNALFFASMLLLEKGDEVIVPDPCYVTYDATIRASGAEPVRVPPLKASGFRPDVDAIAGAVTPLTRAIMITTPNNPTGVVMTFDEISAIAEIARKHDLWVISDEVYAALTFDFENTSIAALPGMAERTVTVSSLSKSHAMTGWRTGWVIGPKAFVEHASNLSLCMLYGLPGFVQSAALEALRNSAAITQEMRSTYLSRRDALLEALKGIPGLVPLTPQSGMFLMADVTGTRLTSAAFASQLYEQERVSVLDGLAFGPSADGFVRLSYTSGHQELQVGGRRIANFCASLPGPTVREASR